MLSARDSLRPIRPSGGDFRSYDRGVQSRPRPLYVPDLSRPAGADIDADGFVRCATCGARVDVMTADVVADGYQCATCTTLAPPPDVYAGMPRASLLALQGVLLSMAAVVMWMLRVDDRSSRGYGDLPLPIWAGVFAAGCFMMAWVRWRKT